MKVLDNHCIKSNSNSVASEKSGFYSGNQTSDQNFEIESKAYQKLCQEYDPRFMASISDSPVTFDFELLSPTRIAKPDNIFKKGYKKLCCIKTDKNHEISTRQPEMSVLEQISKSRDHQNVLVHPVVKAFVWLKWKRAQYHYHGILRTYLLFTYLLTWYIFNEFGGIETNNKCKHYQMLLDKHEKTLDNFPPSYDSSQWSDKSFCDYYRTYSEYVTKHLEYGKTDSKSPFTKMKNDFKTVFEKSMGSDDRYCMYASPFYICFVIIAGAMIFWIVEDIKEMFCSSNPFKRQREGKSQRFWFKILPVVAYLKDICIIIAILLFSHGLLWVSITVVLLCIISREIAQFAFEYKCYFLKLEKNSKGQIRTTINWKNCCDILLIFLAVIVLYVPNEYLNDSLVFSISQQTDQLCDGKPKPNASKITVKNILAIKRALAAFLIILSWTRLLFQIARHPGGKTERFNKYVMMYRTVAKSFLKLMFVYGFFILAFSLGFYVLFHDDIGVKRLKVENDVSPYPLFDLPFETFAKTIAMFVGEVDFNNIPVGVSYARRNGNISSTLAYLFFLCFIFMVVMVLMNLMNGLAVSDIAEIVSKSEIEHQISMINILKELEDVAMNYKKTLTSLFLACPCLKPLLNIFDFEEGLKIFTNSTSTDPQLRQVVFPSLKPPFEISAQFETYDLDTNCMPKMKGRICKRWGRKNKKDGYEHILLEEAHAILLKSNKAQHN